jgi:hypothetical protein
MAASRAETLRTLSFTLCLIAALIFAGTRQPVSAQVDGQNQASLPLSQAQNLDGDLSENGPDDAWEDGAEDVPGGMTEMDFSNLEQGTDKRLSLKGSGVVLQGLDKITARVSTFSVPLDQVAEFGSLKVLVRACYKTPPEEAPENAAFLEIVEQKPDSEARKMFGGWMFSSSPAVSALEHPVYDVWVHNCILPGDAEFSYSSGDAGELEVPEKAAADN